jgi:HEAT repeat protein
LGDSPGPEVVEALAPFLNDSSKEIRKDAALAIAKTGAATITPLIRKAFSDEDEYVRSYALMGLEFALSRSGLPESVQQDLFPDVLNLLRANRKADKAAHILYRFDAEKATEYFLSPELLRRDNPILHQVLKVLADAKVPVPRDDLRSLIDSLEMEELKYPQTYALGEALRLLGQHRREEDRDFLRSRTMHSEERVAEGAAAGLLGSYGLEGFAERIWDAERESGYEALTEHQRLYFAVEMCNAEINNGGLAQYFANSSGDKWRDALAGFKAMGFRERLAVLDEAVAKFGTAGPSTDRSTRQNQLARLYKRDDSFFDALDKRYYKSSEVVEVLASRFVLENPEGFQ